MARGTRGQFVLPKQRKTRHIVIKRHGCPRRDLVTGFAGIHRGILTVDACVGTVVTSRAIQRLLFPGELFVRTSLVPAMTHDARNRNVGTFQRKPRLFVIVPVELWCEKRIRRVAITTSLKPTILVELAKVGILVTSGTDRRRK